MSGPQRIQLRRYAGFKLQLYSIAQNGLPAIKVDRSTTFGNPFIVGQHGTAEYCVNLFSYLCGGLLTISVDADCIERQERFLKVMLAEKKQGYPSLRGKNLACWCRPDKPCHAATLLRIVNAEPVIEFTQHQESEDK